MTDFSKGWALGLVFGLIVTVVIVGCGTVAPATPGVEDQGAAVSLLLPALFVGAGLVVALLLTWFVAWFKGTDEEMR